MGSCFDGLLEGVRIVASSCESGNSIRDSHGGLISLYYHFVHRNSYCCCRCTCKEVNGQVLDCQNLGSLINFLLIPAWQLSASCLLASNTMGEMV